MKADKVLRTIQWLIGLLILGVIIWSFIGHG